MDIDKTSQHGRYKKILWGCGLKWSERCTQWRASLPVLSDLRGKRRKIRLFLIPLGRSREGQSSKILNFPPEFWGFSLAFFGYWILKKSVLKNCTFISIWYHYSPQFGGHYCSFIQKSNAVLKKTRLHFMDEQTHYKALSQDSNFSMRPQKGSTQR